MYTITERDGAFLVLDDGGRIVFRSPSLSESRFVLSWAERQAAYGDADWRTV